ncbi:MAG: DUF21 domain-containing protein [Phycisphaerales bacterium]|nr:DUF21 domain-containing protein [Phycisphaerales bacterium]
MTTTEIVIAVALIVLGTIGASVCAGAEMGLYAINRVKLALRDRAGIRSAKILRGELDRSATTLAVFLLGYNFTSYLAAEGLTTLLREGWGLGNWGVILFSIFVATPVLFVVNDALPKEVFRIRADRLMEPLASTLRAVRVLLTWTGVVPVIRVLTKFVAGLIPGGGASGETEAEVRLSRENIAELLKEGARHGAISESQVGLLDGAMGLRGTTVGDELIPWHRCRVIREDWTRGKVLDYLAAYPTSRLPLVDARGEVLGVVESVKVCIAAAESAASSTTSAWLKNLAGKPVELSPKTGVREALATLIEAGETLAVVRAPVPGGAPAGTRGRVIGIVTVSDLLDPLLESRGEAV